MGPNRIFDAEGLGIALGTSWIALGTLRSRKKTNRDRLLGGQEAHQDEISAHKRLDLGSNGNGKRMHLVASPLSAACFCLDVCFLLCRSALFYAFCSAWLAVLAVLAAVGLAGAVSATL